MSIERVPHSEIFYFKFLGQTKLAVYTSLLLKKTQFVSEFK